jgi:putative ABC transport system permease protein
MFLVAKGGGGIRADVFRTAVRHVDPTIPVYQTMPMDEVVANSMGDRKFSTTLITLFAGLALLLSSVGIYGVMAYTVAQRTQEIGIRMALGARRSDVISLVLGRGLALASVGIGVGLAGAYALTGLMATLLFQVSPTDPVTFFSIAAFLLFISLLASYIPAARASRVDPVIALRLE